MTAADTLNAKLAKPAQRALANAGIKNITQLATYTEKDIAALHGIGKNALKQLHTTLTENGLAFRQ